MATPSFRILPEGVPNRGILFVDRQAEGRSGHGGNCLAECHNGDILAFYSNVSGEVKNGHGVAGWSEYRRSTDGGITWGPPTVLEYSKRAWDGDEMYSALVFAATTAPDGTVIAFLSRFKEDLWVKQDVPVCLYSRDHGHTWSEPAVLDPDATVEDVSLTFDAVFVHNDKVFIAYMGGSANYCPGPYSLYVSEDHGAHFERRSEMPFDPENYYVTTGVLDNGDIIVYSYPYRSQGHINEYDIPYVISADEGHTWSEVQTTHFAKAIRNPQMSSKMGDRYYLHGRSGSKSRYPGNLVLYTSHDGIHWDDGIYLYHKEFGGPDCYSANEVIGKYDPAAPKRLLIQSSIAYEEGSNKVNAHHWWIEPLPPSSTM